MEETTGKRVITPELARLLQEALTADAEELYGVLQKPQMEVIRAALRNRNLLEEHLLVLLKRNDLSDDIPKAIYKNDKIELDHALKLALVKNRATPTHITLTLLPQLRLFELVAICQMAGVSSDKKMAAERAIIKRIPSAPLGHKITLARRCTGPILTELLKEKNPQIAEICLSNPRMMEVGILQFLNSAYPTPETISVIARSEKWKSRPQVRMTILRNPKTPAIWYTLYLPKMSTPEVMQLGQSSRLSAAQRKLVQEEIKKRKGGRV